MDASSPSPPPQQQKLIETLLIPPGAPPIGHILNAEIIGYIRAYPRSEQTRGYIRKQSRIILTPEAQAELNNADDILQWVRFQYCVANGVGAGTATVGAYKCDGCCFIDDTETMCNHRQPVSPGYMCTRSRGHTGDHIGCHGGGGASGHNNQRWPQDLPAPPAEDNAGEIRLRVRYYASVSGTFNRTDERACYVSVPRNVAEEGIQEVRDYITQSILEGGHEDDELYSGGNQDDREDDHGFDNLTTTDDNLREQVEGFGIEPND